MRTIQRFLAHPGACPYLPGQTWQLEFHLVSELSGQEFSRLAKGGWRRFGGELFRPRCPTCRACQPIRVKAADFQPNRQQRRVLKANRDLRLVVGAPTVHPDKYRLYLRHHASRSEAVGWPEPDANSAMLHLINLGGGPLPTEEWCFYAEEELVAICYVDVLDDGYSAVYSVYAPDQPQRSLGTYMILSLIERANERRLPHVYLGYYITGCRSMSYKVQFQPNEVLGPDGLWNAFASRGRRAH